MKDNRAAWAGLGISLGQVERIKRGDRNNSSSLSESQKSLSRRLGSISLLTSCSSVDIFLDTAFLGTYPITLSKLDASTNGIYVI